MAKAPEPASITGKEVARYDQTAGAIMLGGVALDVVEQVTIPILKYNDGDVIVITPQLPISEEDQIDDKTGEVKGKINVVRVVEFGTGQLFNVVLGTVAAGELRDAYPEHSYVGKTFALRKIGLVAGKRYKDVQIVEVKARTPGNEA